MANHVKKMTLMCQGKQKRGVMSNFNPYVFPIKGDISRADAILMFTEANKRKGTIMEFGPGGSTIFLGASGNHVMSFEHDEGWIARVKANVSAYKKTLRQLNVDVHSINYNIGLGGQIFKYISSERPFLYLVDGITVSRKTVLEYLLEAGRQGDVILYHDSRTGGHQRIITDLLYKYFNKLESCYFNCGRSNTTKIVIGEELDYVNWNNEERGNNRVDWWGTGI